MALADLFLVVYRQYLDAYQISVTSKSPCVQRLTTAVPLLVSQSICQIITNACYLFCAEGNDIKTLNHEDQGSRYRFLKWAPRSQRLCLLTLYRGNKQKYPCVCSDELMMLCDGTSQCTKNRYYLCI